MRKQSLVDRKKRLDDGCCPIHGLWMPQSGQANFIHCKECGTPKNWDVVVSCPRKDCEIYAYTKGYYDPRILPKEFQYLLENSH